MFGQLIEDEGTYFKRNAEFTRSNLEGSQNAVDNLQFGVLHGSVFEHVSPQAHHCVVSEPHFRGQRKVDVRVELQVHGLHLPLLDAFYRELDLRGHFRFIYQEFHLSLDHLQKLLRDVADFGLHDSLPNYFDPIFFVCCDRTQNRVLEVGFPVLLLDDLYYVADDGIYFEVEFFLDLIEHE